MIDLAGLTTDKLFIAIIGLLSALTVTLLTQLFTLGAKLIDKKINKENNKSESDDSLRSELMGRIKHLEGRIDQMSTTNLTLVRENALFQAQLNGYNTEMEKTEAALKEALIEVETLRREIDIREKVHVEERESFILRIQELETYISNLELNNKN